MGLYLRAKFHVSSIILTKFRQGVILPPPTSKRTPKKPTQIRVKAACHANPWAENVFAGSSSSNIF